MGGMRNVARRFLLCFFTRGSFSLFPSSPFLSRSRGQSEELLFRDLGRDDAKGLGSVLPILDRDGGMIHDVVDG